MDNSDNPRHLPIHRFKKALPNGHKVKKSSKFDIDKFVEDQNIGYLISSKPLILEALFQPMAGFHLTETPISSDQKLTKTKEGNYLLKVKLRDTSQLRWWLLGFGDQVEILKPLKLRQEFKEKFNNLNNLYRNNKNE